MDYYSDFSTARAGVAPDQDNVALIFFDGFANWLDFPGHAPADFSSGALFFLGSINNVQIGQQAGAGHNDDGTQFSCFQESNQQLFASGSKTCNAMWSCSHLNTVEFHTTNTSIGIIPTSVTRAGSEDTNFVSNVFGNVNQAITNGGGQSCGGSFSFGDGFSIEFTCSGGDTPESLSVLAQFFVTTFPYTVNTTFTAEQQPSCKENPICLRPESAPFTVCCNDQPAFTTYVFPTHGQVVIEQVNNSNPIAGSTPQALISYEITSPPSSDGAAIAICANSSKGVSRMGWNLPLRT